MGTNCLIALCKYGLYSRYNLYSLCFEKILWSIRLNHQCLFGQKEWLLHTIRRFRKFKSRRVFIFVVGIQFLHICFTPPSLSLSLYIYISLFFSLPPSLTHQLPIYLPLSYPTHLSLSFFPPFSFFPFKTIQPMRRVWERVIDWGVSGWEKEGDWKREREREKGEWNRCANIVYLKCIWTLCVASMFESPISQIFIYKLASSCLERGGVRFRRAPTSSAMLLPSLQ